VLLKKTPSVVTTPSNKADDDDADEATKKEERSRQQPTRHDKRDEVESIFGFADAATIRRVNGSAKL